MSDEEKTEIVPLFGGQIDLPDADKLVEAMEDTQNEGARHSDVSFCSFSGKRGLYKIGTAARQPDEGELFLVAITLFELGWMCWKGGQPVGKRFANISKPRIPAPDPEENGPFDERKGEGWSRARSITVRSLQNDEQIYFSNNSKSGVAGMADLQKEVLDRMKSGQDCWPIIELGMEEFTAQGNTNFKPTFEVHSWVSTEDVRKLAAEGADPMSLVSDGGGEEEAPKPRERRRL